MITSFLCLQWAAPSRMPCCPPFSLPDWGLSPTGCCTFELRSLSRLCLYILSPALLFSSLMKVEVTLAQAGQVVAFVVLVLSGMALLGWIYARLRRMDGPTTGAAVMAATFFNAVTLGVPLRALCLRRGRIATGRRPVATNSLPHNTCGLFLAARGVHGIRQSPPEAGPDAGSLRHSGRPVLARL